MKRIIVALILAGLLALATAVPAFAIVDPVTPICTGEGASGGDAGGAAAELVVKDNQSKGPPFPAQGQTKSGTNACP